MQHACGPLLSAIIDADCSKLRSLKSAVHELTTILHDVLSILQFALSLTCLLLQTAEHTLCAHINYNCSFVDSIPYLNAVMI
jgi:hypothetical protein